VEIENEHEDAEELVMTGLPIHIGRFIKDFFPNITCTTDISPDSGDLSTYFDGCDYMSSFRNWMANNREVNYNLSCFDLITNLYQREGLYKLWQ
jgi:hypothetical protein